MWTKLLIFGNEVTGYDFFNHLAYVGAVVVATLLLRQFLEAATVPTLIGLRFNKETSGKSLWRWGCAFVLFMLLIVLTVVADTLANDPISMLFLHAKVDDYFANIFVGPFAVLFSSLLLINSPLKTLDVAAPCMATALIFFKIACFCAGCCYGVEWSGGLYNEDTERVELPIQLIEVACAVIMFVILMVLAKKKKRRHGTLYPLFILMYCGSRFVSEFWRDDYPDVWGPLKAYHIQCIIGFVEGAVMMAVVLIWGEKITAFFEGKSSALVKRFEERYAKAGRSQPAASDVNPKKTNDKNNKD